MGKYKNGKTKPHKKNPVGLPSVIDDGFEMEDDRPSPIHSIIEQLTSPSPDEKMCGLQALSHLCQNERSIQAIISSDIVRIASPYLVDPDFNIRHAAAGAIRNLSAVSVDICENLVEQDVFTPLVMLLTQYSNNDWIPSHESKTNQLDQKSDTFLQAVNIVWNLCESTSIALEYFNQANLLENCFIRCLNGDVFGMDIAISVGQLLLVISEDNASAWKSLGKFGNDLQSILKTDQNLQSSMLITSIAATMANVPELRAQYLKDIIEALGKVLNVNHRSLINDITSKLPLNGEQPETNMEVIDEEMTEETDDQASIRRLKDDLPSNLENEKKLLANLLSAQRIVVEVISNICTSDEEDSKANSIGDEDSDSDSIHDYEVNGDDQQLSANTIPIEIVEIIKSSELVAKIWLRAQPLPENVNQILKEHEKNLFSRAKLLRVSSMICLQNLCSCMTAEDLGGIQGIYDVWLSLGQQVFTAEYDAELVESSTSLMRAALDHLKKSPEFFKQMTQSDLQLMLEGVEKCETSETRANWLKMLGSLGCLLQEDLVRNVVDFLLESTYKEQDVWTMSEALDSFMDMFADNDWNKIVIELNVVGKCKELDKLLKMKMRQQKRELKDRYLAVQNVRTNFSRFCKYLENEAKKFKNSS